MNMQNIWKVWKRDWKHILINPVAIIIVLGLSVIPALYAWINIYACWDIYENTGDIPVAVVNNDKDASYRGNTINIGNSVIENLKENDKIQWNFVSSYEANLGLIDSTYYAMIEIPEDFSSNFLTILSENPVKPKIIYKADTKVNPVASKITESAQDSLVQEIISTFLSTVNEKIFSSLNSVGEYADENQDDLLFFKDAIVSVNRNMDTVTNTLDFIGTSADNLYQFLESISTTIPSIQSGLETVYMDNVAQISSLESAPAVMTVANQNMNLNLAYAQSVNNRIKLLFDTFNRSGYTANRENINATLPAMNSQLDTLENTVDATIDYLDKYGSYHFNSDIDSMIASLEKLKTTLNDTKQLLQTAQTQLNSSSLKLDALYQTVGAMIPQWVEQLDTLNQALSSVISSMEVLNQSLQNQSLTQLISALKGLQTSSTALKMLLEQWDTAGPNWMETVNEINKTMDAYISLINSATGKIDATIKFLNAQKVSNVEKQKQIKSMVSSLEDMNPYIKDQKTQLNAIQQQLNATNTIATSLLDTMNKNSNQIANHLNDAVRLYHNGVNNDIDSIHHSLIASTKSANDLIVYAQNSTKQVQNMLDTAKEGSHLAFEISNNMNDRLYQFKDLTQELSLRFQVLDNDDIAQIISVMQNDPKLMGDFFSNPFELKTETINEIPNYGSSMAPLYTTLALWVGCLLINAVLHLDVGEIKGVQNLTLREKHFGKMFTFLSIATIQGFIVGMGNILFLQIYTVNAPLFVVLTVLSSCVFSIITYTMVSTLGNMGKALCIIYLIFQLAGSGGSYPSQMNPQIFQILKPFFPFTYTLNGLREAVAGPLVVNVAIDIFALSLFAFIFLIFGFLTIKPLHEKVHRFEHNFKESGLGE